MTTIDHRILIPAAPDVVWNYVSDITHNPDWQVDCTDVIFLTSRREGPGLRWRYAAPGGHEMVIAVTAWYNGLGYEYYFVDGTSFRENKGRIRLQEIPEGTIVQWTFTYELGGLFGGMRNALGMRRQVDQTISDSLKTLWQKIKQSGASARTLEPKSLMRDAPDVEARSAYQPRHPSVIDNEALESGKPLRLAPTRLKLEPPISDDDDAQSIPMIAEPPVAEDDTRPRIAYTPPAEPVRTVAQADPDFLDDLGDMELARFEPPLSAKPAIEAAPDFLGGMQEAELDAFDLARFEPPRDPSDTQPRPVVTLDQQQEPQSISSEYTESVADIRLPGEETEALPASRAATLPERETVPAPTEQATAPVIDLGDETQLEIDSEATVQLEGLNTDSEQTEAVSELEHPALAEFAPPTSESATPETPTTPTPTGASIWEIFGVPRPSETQEMRQLEADAAESAAEAVTEAEPESQTLAEVEVQPEPAAEAPLTVAEPAAEVTSVTTAAVAHTLEIPAMPTRLGLRLVQRRKSVRVRRP